MQEDKQIPSLLSYEHHPVGAIAGIITLNVIKESDHLNNTSRYFLRLLYTNRSKGVRQVVDIKPDDLTSFMDTLLVFEQKVLPQEVSQFVRAEVSNGKDLKVICERGPGDKDWMPFLEIDGRLLQMQTDHYIQFSGYMKHGHTKLLSLLKPNSSENHGQKEND